MREKVEAVIQELRPYLQRDGGDIELVSVNEETGRVEVTLQGACGCCPHAAMTLKNGVEARLKQEVPEVSEVVNVA